MNKKKVPLMTASTAKALVKKMGFTELLPCQAQCYRGIFNRRDVILHSRTGSGKTLAYALPIIERHAILETNAAANATGPFLLIFVFSNELAVQTRGVLKKIYPKLRICVAGLEDLASQRCDIVIGTLPSIDEAIRGKGMNDFSKEVKRKHLSKSSRKKKKRKGDTDVTYCDSNKDNIDDEKEDVKDDEEEDEINNNSSDEMEQVDLTAGVVDASNVCAIVVDEVDVTLGPRFSNTGRRMRNLLKFIRKANGSLTDGLITDFRSHHYVLCGATIPNWVIKAGFLGVKKYYYQLVTVGTAKLPQKLDCFAMQCPYTDRVETAARLLSTEGFGRTVVFGSRRQIDELETFLSSKKIKLSFRSLSPSKDEIDRISAIEDFNSNTVSLILCTDLAARGLDFVDVHMVLMLSLPAHNMAVETFVHRAGRTARTFQSGRCLLLHEEREKDGLEAIQKNAHVIFKVYVSRGNKRKNVDGTKSSEKTVQSPTEATTTTTFMLTVRNPFKYTKPTAVVPSALEVLKKNLGELFAEASNVAEDSNHETVTFEYPVSDSHTVKQKLWKFSLKEIVPS